MKIKHTLVYSLLTLFLLISCSQKSMSYGLPAEVPETPEGHEVITLGAGCFWCVEAIMQRLDGVTSVTSGYSNGNTKNPTYRDITRGDTNHAEVCRVVFNPETIQLEVILEWFWKLHDPTTSNRQGNDIGTQYRSGIFYHNAEQKIIAEASLKKHNPKFKNKIVTEITEAAIFYPAEVDHQNYYKINGNKNSYCAAIIPPKLKKLGLTDKEEMTKHEEPATDSKEDAK